MNWNKHSHLTGRHAFLSPSRYSWVNYDEEKLIQTYLTSRAVKEGLRYHKFAEDCINLGQRLPRSRKTLNMFVNDAIGYRMSAEQILFYSPNIFGTADAIAFRKDLLRIHDLKTGTSRVSMVQLEIYTALFCLEYDYQPRKIDMELRIYQDNQAIVHEPEPMVIREIMDKIILFDKKIEEINAMEETWR